MRRIAEAWKVVLVMHFMLILSAVDIVTLTTIALSWVVNLVLFTIFHERNIWP